MSNGRVSRTCRNLFRRCKKCEELMTRIFRIRGIPNGHEQQGFFHIVLQIPGRRIAWRTMSDGFMSGVVSFEPRSQEQTEVTLKIRSIFDPPSLSQRVEGYLRNFKQLVENGEAASVCS